MQPDEKESTHKEKSNKSKSTTEAPAESTQANKGSSVEIVEPHTKKETETAAPKKKPNGPGETTTAKATEEKPKGPGETKATKEPTVEPVPTKEDLTEAVVPPVPTAQTVEPKPE